MPLLKVFRGPMLRSGNRKSRLRCGDEHYGLHRHFTGGTSVLMFGGGMKRGCVYGKTADERPLVAVENPVSIADLHATIMTAMGISPQTGFDIEGRPFYVTQDGRARRSASCLRDELRCRQVADGWT